MDTTAMLEEMLHHWQAIGNTDHPLAFELNPRSLIVEMRMLSVKFQNTLIELVLVASFGWDKKLKLVQQIGIFKGATKRNLWKK